MSSFEMNIDRESYKVYDQRGKSLWMDVNNHYHKVDGPALVDSCGRQLWYWHGLRHRIGGPAVIEANVEEWWVHGRQHRTDGPAIESMQFGHEWWVNGRQLTEDEFYLYVDTLSGEVLIPPGKVLLYES